MKGLALARSYWEEVGRPAFEENCPEALARCAVGLAGEGSECFGFDDETSRDHDWGPGFCLWLSKEDFERWGEKAGAVYAALPPEFHGYRRLRPSVHSAGRVGVLERESFFYRFLGVTEAPKDLAGWFRLSDSALATATNGEVFFDADGRFSEIRAGLSAHYPEDVYRKKLAAACALAAQSGQYNYARCARRGETVAATLAAAQFISQAQQVVFLLNRKYKPYYKWAQRALGELPLLGNAVAPWLDRIAGDMGDCADAIEAASALIIAELKRQGLSGSGSDFLLPHAEEVQSTIRDPLMARLPLMAG